DLAALLTGVAGFRSGHPLTVSRGPDATHPYSVLYLRDPTSRRSGCGSRPRGTRIRRRQMRTLASWAGIALLALVAFLLSLLAFALLLVPAANAAPVSSVLGIPCTTQSNGVQACH